MAVVSIPIRIHQIEGGVAPAMETMRYVDGATFINGVVLVDSGGSVDEAGADPDPIIGIALQGAATNPGYDINNAAQTTTYTGRQQTVTVSRPNDQTIYAAQLTTSSSTAVAPTQANVNQEYGITAYSHIWTVDTGKTGGSARVMVIGFSTDVYGVGIVFFKFLNAAIT